jgi:hypothetical protein
VILRLGYDFDIDSSDQMGTVVRLDAAFGRVDIYRAWLGYIAKIHQSVAGFHNVHGAYLSWEDFWIPVQQAEGATTPAQQLQLATTVDYRSWLRHAYPLATVSNMYGTEFTTWSQVPTPSYNSPSFKLMYQFDGSMTVNRFFLPAQKQFPDLTLEARVDVDPIYSG